MSLRKVTTISVCFYAGCIALISGLVWYLQAHGFTLSAETKSEPPVCVKEVAVVCKSTWSVNDDCKEWDLSEYTVTKVSEDWGRRGLRIESKTNLTEKYTYRSFSLRSYDIVCKEYSNGK